MAWHPDLYTHVDDDFGYVAVMCLQQRYLDWRNGKVLLNVRYDRSPDGKLEPSFVKASKAWSFIRNKYGADYDDAPQNVSFKYTDDQLDTLARYGLMTYETITDENYVHFTKKFKTPDGATVYAIAAFVPDENRDDDWDE